MVQQRLETVSRLRDLDAQVRRMLAEDLPAQLASLRDALDRQDLMRAVHEVHAIHGSAAFCRLEELRKAAAMLEASLRDTRRDAARLQTLEDNINAVLLALEQEDIATGARGASP